MILADDTFYVSHVFTDQRVIGCYQIVSSPSTCFTGVHEVRQSKHSETVLYGSGSYREHVSI